MFGLGKGNRLTLLESQIDNARGQRQWPVVFELVRKYAKSNPDSQLEWLIKAEYALDLAAQDTQEVKKLQELIIEHDRAQEFDPDQADDHREQIAAHNAQIKLCRDRIHRNYTDARTALEGARRMDPAHKETLALAGRLEYEDKNMKKAMEYLEAMGNPFDMRPVPVTTPHQTRVILEAQLIRGLCEELGGRHDIATATYTGVLTAAEQAFGGSLTTVDSMSRPIVEKALLRRALLHFSSIDKSIDMLRRCLSAPVELSPETSRIALRVLCKVLLRDTCLESYPFMAPPPSSSSSSSTANNALSPSVSHTSTTSTTANTSSSSSSIFVPQDETEEAILALIHLEKYLNPGLTPHQGDLQLYDELCIAFSRKHQYSSIVDVYERSLGHNFLHLHQWHQLALALMSSGRYKRAMLILAECMIRDPTNPCILLLAAKICINHLDQIHDGIEFSSRAVEILAHSNDEYDSHTDMHVHPSSFSSKMWLGRAYLALGTAYSKKSVQSKSYAEREEYQELALVTLRKAHALAPSDHHASFHLALLYADIRDIPLAIQYCKVSLAQDREFVLGWILLALLTSSNKLHRLALQICQHGLEHSPNHPPLLCIKAKLELALEEPLQALNTYKSIFSQFSHQQKTAPPDPETAESVWRGRMHSGPSSIHSMEAGSETSRSILSGKSRAASVAPALNDADLHPEDGIMGMKGSALSMQVTHQKVQMWLDTAEAFTLAGLFQDAIQCLQEAKALDPTSPDVFYREGFLLERQDLMADAFQLYQKALSIDCRHLPSIIRTAVFYQRANKAKGATKPTNDPYATIIAASSPPLPPRLRFANGATDTESQDDEGRSPQTNEAHLLAENYLSGALRTDPTSHQAWMELGRLLKDAGQEKRASDCFLRAIELEKTAPIVPFSSIPREIF
eukprot:TRINITY_DN4611_c0_g1_i2.p1 TRINITY_DN4611_c0_g1~~TRINITY_DN4611_c0_g1_i2.p1  ORF type:complete len:910 (-),score=285.90 TRINITY_DN4611_c0_g1_i2:18-2747(-)